MRGQQSDLREVEHGHVVKAARQQRAGQGRGAPTDIHDALMRPDARKVDHLQGHAWGSLVPAHGGRAALLEDPVPVCAAVDAGGHREACVSTCSPAASQASKPPIASVA